MFTIVENGDKMLKLAKEAIFHTIQGEGKYVGYPSTFVRLSGCNLRCAWKNKDGSITRCDTEYTSFNPEKVMTSITDIVEEVEKAGFNHVVISGGEPFVQGAKLAKLISLLPNNVITIETNGTIYHPTDADFISISPKLSNSCASIEHSRLQEQHRINYDALEMFIKHYDYQFKFVINNYDDVKEVNEIARNLFDRTQIDINSNIWIMPQGTNVKQLDEKMKFLVELCKVYNWKLTDRLHIRIWGDKRGV